MMIVDQIVDKMHVRGSRRKELSIEISPGACGERKLEDVEGAATGVLGAAEEDVRA